jgi:hypothetical protein
MKQKILNALYFLRLTDSDGLLSLTHLTVFVSLYKVLVAPTYSITEVSTLLIAMLTYGFKKHLAKGNVTMNDQNKEMIQKIEQRLAQLADKQSAVATAMGFKPMNK